jgi:uncharacterized membrane protein
MANEKFSIKEALGYGWATFKSNVPFFLGLMVVMSLISFVPDFTADKVFGANSLPHTLAKILLRIVGLILGMITTKISLDIVDHGQADLSRLGDLAGIFVPYLIGKILYGVIVLVGLVLLIVPGLIASYMFLYVGYLIIDRKIGAIEALKESRAITDGVKWDLFLFSLLVGLINIVGVLCLLVGLFVTIPVTLMASAYVYRKLSPAQG